MVGSKNEPLDSVVILYKKFKLKLDELETNPSKAWIENESLNRFGSKKFNMSNTILLINTLESTKDSKDWFFELVGFCLFKNKL